MHNIKRIAITGLVVMNIALVGGVAGAIAMHNYDNGQTKTTQSAIQAVLKTVPVAQAASK